MTNDRLMQYILKNYYNAKLFEKFNLDDTLCISIVFSGKTVSWMTRTNGDMDAGGVYFDRTYYHIPGYLRLKFQEISNELALMHKLSAK